MTAKEEIEKILTTLEADDPANLHHQVRRAALRKLLVITLQEWLDDDELYTPVGINELNDFAADIVGEP